MHPFTTIEHAIGNVQRFFEVKGRASRAERAVTTGSLSRLSEAMANPPCAGRGARRSSPVTAGPGRRVRGLAVCELREQAERAMQVSNYWSSSSLASNPNNAWNVNFNNGNVDNDNKNNNNHARAVRSGR